MAIFSTSGIDRYALSLDELWHIPKSVIEEMVLAEGAVIRKGQAEEAAAMLQGPYYAGDVAKGASLGKPKKTADGKCVYVSFKGTAHGNRVAEIAFINEFGKKNQPPRPFISTANEKHAEAAVEAAAKVYDEYLKKNNL